MMIVVYPAVIRRFGGMMSLAVVVPVSAVPLIVVLALLPGVVERYVLLASIGAFRRKHETIVQDGWNICLASPSTPPSVPPATPPPTNRSGR